MGSEFGKGGAGQKIYGIWLRIAATVVIFKILCL